jgi:integrase
MITGSGGGVKYNIASGGKLVKKVQEANPDGHHTMTLAEYQQYCAHHPRGTEARLGGALCWNVGGRIGDIGGLGHANRHGNSLTYTPEKTRRRKQQTLTIPILDDLKQTLAASKLGLKTFLADRRGKPYSPNRLSKKMVKWCAEAGLPHCTAHSFRKGLSTHMANQPGTTIIELCDTFAYTPKIAERYMAKRSQKTNATRAMKRAERGMKRRAVDSNEGRE